MQNRRVLGMMSGTSMDGVDAAIVTTDGEDTIEYGPFMSVDYPPEVRERLLAARGWSPSDDVARLVEAWHGHDVINDPSLSPELIGFHGQTLAHDPDAGRTLQAGSGTRLADMWRVPVVWDFRSDDMDAGGQGAPLAPLFHFHALRAAGVTGTTAVLNLGGVGNVTFVDLDRHTVADDGAILAFDTGPANALMDDVARQRLGLAYDKGGEIAAAGKVDNAIVDEFGKNPFFAVVPPKSLDRDHFAAVLDQMSALTPENALATLNAITCASVAAAETHFPKPVTAWYVTGGGRHNAATMQGLRERLSSDVRPIEDAGLNGDMLEAQAFAWLAVRVERGLPTSLPSTTGCRAPTCGGKISHPR